MIFDSHCHPQMEQYDQDREEVLGRAREAGIRLICVGTDYETSKKGIALIQQHENMWASVGLHPNDVDSELRITDYEVLVKEDKVVAVGEIGLDYYRTPEPDKQEKQKEIFEQFLDLAMKYDKPVIIHSRDSDKGSTGRVHADMIPIIENWKFKIENSARLWRAGVAHSFTGGIDDARKYLELGFCLGFNGILTFTHQYDELVKYAPLDRILLETDAPFLTPLSHRSSDEGGRTRNEPAYIIEVAKKIAELKNETVEKVIEQTTKNCKELFQI
ncbi:MAG: hypothetical protein A2655_02640 [Candidatus Yanofskybacteria bacterium RIFCSPHIGHO2_01_FULL_43_42]|uniref:Hydrolase TatD n=1 Tax=Candidatus Yanofskybacteria bacterium RIFCSPLOWO2_01_FULL_43_22 TaxID=1802695 RepID=A0A1F8GJL3_9BACT|nr:MAG: hypothetical protein A2655_02640 [Candidatus Yanofskybacteria bacterium RIFCSPHIGHO2_01_FULL_43_42]OGN12447.1 MAG: hypothetical protein A3D48_00560 [Candidatus Yanofskybacteria bacterium RIFCSPHIGHO2_02_FULL_43_17]OGN24908.1 MAG: hypothetical protein A3A13_03085 [Candidatus Yanofskybacteria bacterium RIFCSPLOWO2_01_FULL_43_22]